jgi:chloride channel 7
LSLQSLDYDICENSLVIDEERTKGYRFIAKKDLIRWIIMIGIGIITALIACSIDIAIEEGSAIKFGFLKKQVDDCVTEGCLIIPFGYWVLTNVGPVVLGSLLVVYVEVCMYDGANPNIINIVQI